MASTNTLTTKYTGNGRSRTSYKIHPTPLGAHLLQTVSTTCLLENDNVDDDDAAADDDGAGDGDGHTITNSVNIKRVLIVLLMIWTYKTPLGQLMVA